MKDGDSIDDYTSKARMFVRIEKRRSIYFAVAIRRKAHRNGAWILIHPSFIETGRPSIDAIASRNLARDVARIDPPRPPRRTRCRRASRFGIRARSRQRDEPILERLMHRALPSFHRLPDDFFSRIVHRLRQRASRPSRRSSRALDHASLPAAPSRSPPAISARAGRLESRAIKPMASLRGQSSDEARRQARHTEPNGRPAAVDAPATHVFVARSG